MKNNDEESNPKQTPLEERPDAIPADWPGDHTIPPGVYPDKKNDETTVVPLVR